MSMKKQKQHRLWKTDSGKQDKKIASGRIYLGFSIHIKRAKNGVMYLVNGFVKSVKLDLRLYSNRIKRSLNAKN